VVKGSSANKVQLSADNFLGPIESYVMLSYLDKPAYPIEWVREDSAAVRENDDRMPTAPGVYYLEVLKAPTMEGEAGQFVIDPLLTVTDEPVLVFQSGIEREAQLQNLPAQGTLRLWENRDHALIEGKDYQVDYANGAVTFLTRFYPRSVITADYRHAAPTIGPVDFYWNTANHSTLPGVVLAFGKRARTDDKVAIVVYADRQETAHAYGGQFEVSFDLDVISRDPIQMEEIADYLVMALWVEKRARFSSEGIEIKEVSMGGEAEESYDEQADLMFYNASVSLQLAADWEVHYPIPLTISRVTPTSAEADVSHDADRRTSAPSTLVPVTSDIFFATAPVIVNRNASFERIG
jgi:hypothetical protein